METKEMTQDKTKQDKTRKDQTKPDMTYPFTLAMDEGGNALMDYIKATYGNRGAAVKVQIITGNIVVSIDPLGA